MQDTGAKAFQRAMIPRLCLLVCVLLIASGATASAGYPLAASLVNPDKLRYPELRFVIPKAEKIVLANGMTVYFMEDHEVPLVAISSVVRSGSVYDPAGKEGLAELTARVMRTGGTAEMTGSMVDDELEFLAASLNVAMNRESGTASLSVLKKDLDIGLKIFSQILMTPAFEEDRLKLAKDLKIEELKRIADDPQKLAFREFNRILYRNNARGKLPTLTSVQNIQRDDLVSFHKQFFFPGNIMLAITGDIIKDEAMNKISKYFGGWRSQAKPAITIGPPTKQKGGVYFLPKSVPQAVIIHGNLAPAENDADHYPFEILNFVIGSGGFKSRIFQEVRNKRGLAYSTGSFYQGRSNYGVFGAYALTKSESAADSLSLIGSILAEVKKGGITNAERTRAQKSIINSFIFSFLSAEQIAYQQLMSEYDRLPNDYLERYRERINGVRSDQLKEVAAKYLMGDDAVILVLGEETIFDQLRSTFGDVQKIEEPFRE